MSKSRRKTRRSHRSGCCRSGRAGVQPVGEVAAEQAEDASGKRRDIKEVPDPHLYSGEPGAAPVSSSSAGRTISGSISSS